MPVNLGVFSMPADKDNEAEFTCQQHHASQQEHFQIQKI